MAEKQYLVRMSVVEKDAEGKITPVVHIKPIELPATTVESLARLSPGALRTILDEGAQRLARGLRRKLVAG